MSESENNVEIEVNSEDNAKKLRRFLEDAKSVQSANRALVAENEELKQTLTQIAEKTLNENCDRFHIDKNLSDDQKIEAVKEAQLNRSSTASLYGNENIGNNRNNAEIFDSTEDALLAISKSKKAGNLASHAIEVTLMKKFLQKPINLELESGLKDLARKPIKSSLETPEDYEKKLNDAKKRQCWKNLNLGDA